MAVSRIWMFLWVFCLGCTHAPVHLVPGDCPTQAIFGAPEIQTPYTLEYEYWSFGGAKKILLSDILKKGPHRCDELDVVEWSFVQQTSDVLLSLLPFASRARVFLSYSVK